MDLNNILDFDFKTEDAHLIKVIGVGGGGGNAVSHMYRKGIHDVSFVLCNTDSQALKRSEVPTQIILGRETTKGLGAGNKPAKAKTAAEESMDEIRQVLNDGTQMAFITAGMGGGTGTGAGPVIAKIAKDMGILTVGIVTIPFLFEGKTKILQALNGVEEMAANVDALLVINNERLYEIYADLTVLNAFGKADDTLATAAKSIAEIITQTGVMNLDFADVETTMKDGGVALMSNGFGEGEQRVQQAVAEALNSPLLSNNDVKNAHKILFNIYSSETSPLKMDELAYFNEFMAGFNTNIEVIWGIAIDETLGEKVKIMIIATGFSTDVIEEMVEKKQADAFLRTEEQIMVEELRKKKEERENKLLKKYYDSMVTPTGRSLPRPQAVILTDEEMDDDTFIALLEEHPAYNRDVRVITKARAKAVPEEDEPANPPRSSGEPGGGSKPTIRFN